MKVTLILLLFFKLMGTSDSNSPDLSSCRAMMDQAVDEKASALKFYKTLKSIAENDQPVLVGFRGMSEFLMCKHLLNPFSRLSHFNKGKYLLSIALKKDQTNPELLLFRLSTQTNVPAVLNYSSNIEEDKNALITYLIKHKENTGSDLILYKRIKTYLLMNKYCTASEKARIKTL